MTNPSSKLVVIMFTDIVGYTAMMGKNEKEALETVTYYEQVIRELTDQFDGELINFYGDGSLTVFSSINSSLSCAMEIQTKFKTHVSVPLRIGIHIGEAIFQNGNVYGDSVNIASRIESLGQAGAILFSEDVYQKVRNNYKATSLGSFEFKNIDYPINVYALAHEGFHVPAKSSIKGKLKTESKEIVKSIAVLPFEKQSSNDEHQFFVDGIADEIRSQLSLVNELRVISRSSCMFFRDRNYSLKQVGDELDVSYVLEGRVQIIMDHVKVSVDLSNVQSDKQVWSLPSWSKKMEDVFSLQNLVAQSVTDELRIVLTKKEIDQLSKIQTSNQDAFLEYQKGLDLFHRGHGKPEELEKALSHFNEAIAIDPSFSRAYVGISDTYLEYIFWGRNSTIKSVEPAMKAALKALELDSTSGESYGALGSVNFFKFNQDIAVNFLNRAIELSPNYLGAYEKLAWINVFNGEFEKALELFKKTQSLDPLSTKYIGDTGHAYYYNGRFKEGVDYMSLQLTKHTNDPWLIFMKAYLYSGMEEYNKAIELLTSRDTSGKNTNWMLGFNYGMVGKKEEAHEILELHLNKREIGFVPAYMIAVIYIGMKDEENALKWLEQDALDGGQGLFFMGLKTDPKFKHLHSNARFQALIKITE
jgi:adenylate cyclase